MTDPQQTPFERWWEEQQRFPHKPGYKQLTRFAWNAAIEEAGGRGYVLLQP